MKSLYKINTNENYSNIRKLKKKKKKNHKKKQLKISKRKRLEILGSLSK